MARGTPLLCASFVPHPSDGARLGAVSWYIDADPYLASKVAAFFDTPDTLAMLDRAKAILGPLPQAPLHTLCPAAGPAPMLALKATLALGEDGVSMFWSWKTASGRAAFVCMSCGKTTQATDDLPTSAHGALASWTHSMAAGAQAFPLAQAPYDPAHPALLEALYDV